MAAAQSNRFGQLGPANGICFEGDAIVTKPRSPVSMMVMLVARPLAAASLLIVMVLTLGPVEWRGLSLVSTSWDRSLAFATFACLGCLAFPRRPTSVALGLAALIVALELAQGFSSERHADFEHVLQKAFGATIGFCIGYIVAATMGLRNARRSRRPRGASKRRTP